MAERGPVNTPGALTGYCRGSWFQYLAYTGRRTEAVAFVDDPGRQLALGVVQNHDLNPGVAQSGLFWTAPTSDESVTADPAAGTAVYEVTDLAIGDYANIPNGVIGGPSVPAKASFHITWSPGAAPKHFSVSDAEDDFGGDFVAGVATAQWSMSEDGFTFTSGPASASKSLVAVVGAERNGEFFSP